MRLRAITTFSEIRAGVTSMVGRFRKCSPEALNDGVFGNDKFRMGKDVWDEKEKSGVLVAPDEF